MEKANFPANIIKIDNVRIIDYICKLDMKGKMSLGAKMLWGLLRLLGRLPLSFHHRWGRRLGRFLGKRLRYRREVVLTNLGRCFPDRNYDEISAICNRFYEHFGTTLTEMIWFGACRGDKGRERLHKSRIVELVNPEELNRLYGGARQLMILQAHTGNWELIGGIKHYSYTTPIDLTPDAFAVTYLHLASPLWDQVMRANRTAPVADQGFDGYVEASQVLRYALSRKTEKFGYAFITDQYPYSWGVPHPDVEFMHQQTPTMTAAAGLACKLDMAVAYLRFLCREDGGYRMEIVPLSDHAAGENPIALMQRYYKLLQEDLEKQPWNYLWTHKRWK